MKRARPEIRPVNQRLSTSRQRKQQHLLDVKVRSQRVSHHRNRRVLVLLSKITLALLLCGGVYYGIRQGLSHFFFDNPDYRLGTIEAQTDGTLQREQILKTAELREGLNIFSINLASVHDRLQQLPQVDEVQVERKMPNEIDIRIVERKPIAWITTEKTISDPFASDAAFLVDARGTLMKEKKLLPEYLGLPLISGCGSEALVAGKMVESFEGRAALDLLRLSTTSFMQTRFQIREINVSKGYCLLVTDKNHTQVMFGFDHLEAQMQRLEQFLIYSDDSKRELESVNLLVARNIPVTFAKPVSAVISEAADDEPVPRPEKEVKAPAPEPRILKAKPVTPAKAEPSTHNATKPRATSSPVPVRKAVPVQHFNLGEKSNGE